MSLFFCNKKSHEQQVMTFFEKIKARDGTRTRGLDLGKVALHQLSHSRISFVLSQAQVIYYYKMIGLSTGK